MAVEVRRGVAMPPASAEASSFLYTFEQQCIRLHYKNNALPVFGAQEQNDQITVVLLRWAVLPLYGRTLTAAASAWPLIVLTGCAISKQVIWFMIFSGRLFNVKKNAWSSTQVHMTSHITVRLTSFHDPPRELFSVSHRVLWRCSATFFSLLHHRKIQAKAVPSIY